ncbi:DUF4269 domain-containing protein [Brevibacillus sp. SYSU BS000544]|uniref:DUF4269 domain-containing protein n=1 Tax=Brevibacillus sp. SYSU BS000544 TaxID=3416443 RepID=UPI003CE4C8C7
MDWQTLTYLLRGTERQKAAYKTIQSLNIIETLKAFDPILVGTIPLKIDILNSDLDIICEVHDFPSFNPLLQDIYGNHTGFCQVNFHINDIPTSVTNFFFEGFEFEIFAQPIPTKQQNAYRHMIIEKRLLSIGGAESYRAIRDLKATGYKTEPAFVAYFQIECDDPYLKLLEMESMSDDEIKKMLSL